jgi:hypothetical protein
MHQPRVVTPGALVYTHKKKKGPGDLTGTLLDSKSRLHRTSPPSELTRLPALNLDVYPRGVEAKHPGARKP